MRDFYDVLILGAGAAGLAAARALAQSGRRIAVIEARDRVGGRIFTRHVMSAAAHTTLPVELGAEFVHGLPLESWRAIREAGLETYELDGSALTFADGHLQSAKEERAATAVLRGMMRWLAQQPAATDETFADYLRHADVTESQRRETVRYVEGFNAADHRLIGVASLAKQQEAENLIEADRIFHLRAGYDSLPLFLQEKTLAAGGEVFLAKPVTAIAWHPGAVSMSGTDPSDRPFTFRGAAAVITLPLGVLQSGSVRFDPEPAAVLSEASRMAMGSVIRVPLIFRSRFWQDEAVLQKHRALAGELRQLGFLFTDSAAPATWWTAHPNEAPMLVGWTAGPSTTLMQPHGVPAAIRDRCLNGLADIFRIRAATLAERLLAWHFHDWDADPFARGAYSYVPAGALMASANMAEPVSRTLYFAGEHTTLSGHWGTVHGALQTGEAAAARIVSRD